MRRPADGSRPVRCAAKTVGIARLAGIVAGALLLAYAVAFPAPVQAQTSTDPLWSTTMTVGESTKGQRGYSSSAGGEGTVDDSTFRLGGLDYSVYEVFVLTNGELRLGIGRPFNVSSNYTLEFAGETLPLDDATGGSSSTFYWDTTWLATNAPSLSLANYLTTLAVDAEVKVCLRTATQVCPGGGTTTSTDATLSALTVNDGTTEHTINLATTPYTQTVGNAVETVTLTATTNHTGASVSAVTLGGTAIDDTDFTDGITVPSLAVGANVIVVTVTAEDGSTTQPYTVTVTRETATTNNTATGRPTIDGTPQVGQTLTADVSDIEDEDGLPSTFTYRWVRVAADSMETNVGTGSTYTLLTADVGSTIRVHVSFTDDADNSESPLPSDATAVVVSATAFVCTDPDLSDRTEVWSGEITVENSGDDTFGFENGAFGLLSDTDFNLGSTDYTISRISVQSTALFFALDTRFSNAAKSTLTLHLCGTELDLSEAFTSSNTHVWTSTDLDWSGATTIKAALSAPAPTVSIGDASATEGSPVEFAVTLSEATAYDVTLSYATSTESDDTASSADYTAASGTVTIPAGQTGETGQTVTVATIGDVLDEDDETFTVTLSSTSLGFESTANTATGTIEDNDDPQTFLGTSLSANESAGNFIIEVEIEASGRTVSMDWATVDGTAKADADYTAASGTLEFMPGETRKQFEVAIDDDDVSELDETFSIRFSNPANIVADNVSFTVTIVENDPEPVVSLMISETSISENGGTAEVTAELDRASGEETTVSVTANAVLPAVAADFRLSSNTVLTIPAGSLASSNSVTITAVNNDVYEPGKTVSVQGTVTNAVGATGPESVELTIDEDDVVGTATVTLTLDKNIIDEDATSESARRVTVTATLGTALPDATTVTVSVAEDTATSEDFTAVEDFTVTILANQVSGEESFLLAPVNDNIDEPDETVTVTATVDDAGLTVAPAAGLTVTIRDNDDTPKVTLELSPSSVPEGGMSDLTATLGHPSSEDTVVTLSADPAANATLGGTTITILAGQTEGEDTVTVTAYDDNLAGGGRKVTLSGMAQNDLGVTDPDDVELTITDNESASTQVQLEVFGGTDGVAPNVVEGSDSSTLMVKATLSGSALTTATVVTVTITGDTATAGIDFTAVPQFTVTIPATANDGTATFTMATINDDIHEPAETLSVTGTAPGLTVNPTSFTITDDDLSPKVTLELDPESIGEASGETTVRATLNHPSSQATTITVRAEAVSPAVAADFTLSGNRTLTIVAGQTESTGVVTITANNNDVAGDDADVTVSGTAANALGIDQPDPVTLTIENDDLPSQSVAIEISPTTIDEGSSTNVTVTATLDRGALTSDLDLTITVGDSTDDTDGDYVPVSDFILTIPAGDKSNSEDFMFTANEDDIDEANETVTVDGTVSGSGLTVTPATLTIVDTDETPTVTLELGANPISENGGSTTVTAKLSNPSSRITTVVVSANPDGSAEAADFMLSSGTTLEIPAGATGSTGTVTISAVDNDIYETGKSVSVGGSATNDLGVEPPDAVTLDIEEDDTASAEVRLSLSNDTVSEDATGVDREVTVTATLDNAARPEATEVTVTVSGSGAGTVAPVTVTIPAGEKTGENTLTLQPTNDNINGPDLTVTVEGMTTASGLTVVPAAGLPVTISEDDPTPVAELVLTPNSIPETGETSTVTARLNHPSSEATILTISAEPGGAAVATDFVLSANPVLTIPAGQMESMGTVTVTTVDNVVVEQAKSVTVSVSSVVNDQGVTGPDAVSLEITDNEVASTAVTLTVLPTTVGEGVGASGQTITVTATLDGDAEATQRTVTVTVSGGTGDSGAVAGTDFAAVSDFTIEISAGDTSATGTFTLTPLHDDIDEADETVTVDGTVSGSGLTVTPATLTILDDDADPTVTLELGTNPISEDSGSTAVTATLNHPSSGVTTVVVSADPGGSAEAADFMLSGTMLEIPVGATESTGTVTISAVDNDIYETGKSVSVSGSATNDLGVDPPDAVTLDIDEDDTASTTVTLSLDLDEVSESDGSTGGRKVTVTAELGEAARPDDLELTVEVGGGTAVAGTDYTAVADRVLTISAGDTEGSAEFDLIPVDDGTDEPDKTLLVSATTTASGLTVEPAGGIEMTIVDDDPDPVVTLVLGPASIPEEGGEAAVTATLDRPSSAVTTIEVSSSPVGEADDGDFRQNGVRLTIPAGEMDSEGTVTITAIGNVVAEEDKRVTVTGIATNDQGIVQPAPVELVIADDEVRSTALTLQLSLQSIEEGETGADRRLTLTGTLNAAARPDDVTVTLMVEEGTADEGRDFAAFVPETVTLVAGTTSFETDLDLVTLNDNVHEAEETVTVTATVVDSQGQSANLSVISDELGITDNDTAPVAKLVLTPNSIPESGEVSTVTATLTHPSGVETVIEVNVTPVPPATTDVFTQTGSLLVIAAGETESLRSVTITGVDDTETGVKEVTVSGTATNGLGVGQPEAQILTISDDDAPSTEVVLTVSPSRIAEDATGVAREVTVTATLNGAVRASDVDIRLTVADGTALYPDDYEPVPNFTLTVPANTARGTATFILVPEDDDIDEPNETVKVVLPSSADGLTVLPGAGLEVTIEDNDATPEVTLHLASSSISEDGGDTAVTATLDRKSGEPTFITIRTTPVSPAVDDDFRQNGAVLTIRAGQTESEGRVTIAAVNNEVSGTSKEVTVSGSAENDHDIDQPTAQTLTITEDDVASTVVMLTLSPEEVREGTARQVTVMAMLDGIARPNPTELEIRVSGGTADEGVDFAQVQPFTLEIPAGQKSGSASFTLTAFDNAVSGPDKTVLVEATTTSGLSIEEPSDGLVVTITDDEDAPVASLVLTPASIREDGGESVVTAVLDRPSSAETTVTVSAAAVSPAVPGDFQLSGGTLRVIAGETESTGTVTITAVDNEVSAQPKRVTVSGTAENSQRVEGPADATLTITDNDSASTTVTLSALPTEVTEGSSRTVTVTAELDGAAREVDTVVAVTVSVGTATATDDFDPVEDVTVTIPAGDKSGTAPFTLSTVDDAIDEPEETVRLRGPSRASGLRVAPSGGIELTIADNDPAPRVTLVLTPDSISENGGSSTVRATLDHPSSQGTTVTVTATAQTPAVAGDFRLRGARLTIPAGQTESTGTVTIAGVNNELTAPSKRVTVSGVAENTQGIEQPQAVDLTITDDDQPSTMVTLTVSPDRVAEDGGAKRLTVTGMLDGAPESADTVVTLSVSAGAAEAVEATLTILTGQRSATAVLNLTPVDNAIDAADATVRVNASSASFLTLNPSSLEVTVTDDDERGVTVSATALTVREGTDGGATYTVVLGSQPTGTVTVTPSVQSPPSGANLEVNPSSLSFTASNWNEPQTVTVTAQDDQDVEEDAVVELTHTVSGGDYGSNNVASSSVTVTVLGFEEDVDGTVTLRVPMSGDRVVTVPEGTSVPAGTRVTLPSAGGTVEFAMVADDHEALRNPPRGFRSGDTAVDIKPDPPLAAGQTATVCLPAMSGSQRVHRWDEDASEWVELDAPAGGSPSGLACGVTDHFSLFALGMAPNETVAKAWLARFGRTVAEHVVDGVQSRLTAPREVGLHGTLAGQSFGGPAAAVPSGPDDLPGWPETGPGGAEDDLHMQSRSVTGRELLTGSAFALTGLTEGGGSAAVWGRGMHTRFEGSDGDASLDGEVSTGLLGADYAVERWTAGMVLSRSEGSGTYRLEDRKDEIETSQAGLYPYFGYEITDRLSVWGVAGYGTGSLTLTSERGESTKTDLLLSMAAVGARGDLISAEGAGDFALALETDALVVRTSVDAVEGLEAVDADASRLRLGLESSWTKAMVEGGESLTPLLKLGLRHDGGDAETGLGVEIGVGVAWTDAARGLSGELDVHGLLVHEADKFEEQGISGSLSWDRDRSSEQGLAMTVRQSLGAEAAGGAGDLLERQTMAGLRQTDGAASAGRLDAKLGYGLPMLGNRLTGTPWLGLGLSGNARDYTLGWRLGFAQPDRSRFRLGLEANRREPANDNVPEHRVGLTLGLRW